MDLVRRWQQLDILHRFCRGAGVHHPWLGGPATCARVLASSATGVAVWGSRPAPCPGQLRLTPLTHAALRVPAGPPSSPGARARRPGAGSRFPVFSFTSLDVRLVTPSDGSSSRTPVSQAGRWAATATASSLPSAATAVEGRGLMAKSDRSQRSRGRRPSRLWIVCPYRALIWLGSSVPSQWKGRVCSGARLPSRWAPPDGPRGLGSGLRAGCPAVLHPCPPSPSAWNLSLPDFRDSSVPTWFRC